MTKDRTAPLFRRTTELIRVGVAEWYRHDPTAVICADAHALTIRGLLARDRQAETWWLYVVDATRLRGPGGPEAVALEFVEQYEVERKAFR